MLIGHKYFKEIIVFIINKFLFNNLIFEFGLIAIGNIFILIYI